MRLGECQNSALNCNSGGRIGLHPAIPKGTESFLRLGKGQSLSFNHLVERIAALCKPKHRYDKANGTPVAVLEKRINCSFALLLNNPGDSNRTV